MEIRSIDIYHDTIYVGTYNNGIWKQAIKDIHLSTLEHKNSTQKVVVNPNPINESSVITYQLPETGMVSLKVYDIMGRDVTCNVCTMIDGEQAKGEHTLKFDAEGLRSGVYFVELSSENNVSVARFIKE